MSKSKKPEQTIYSLDAATNEGVDILKLADRHFLLRPLVIRDVKLIRKAGSDLDKVMAALATPLSEREVTYDEERKTWVTVDDSTVDAAWCEAHLTNTTTIELTRALIHGEAPSAGK